MGRAVGAAAAAPLGGRYILPTFLLLLASMVASEGATQGASGIRPTMLDSPLFELQMEAHEQGRESPSSHSGIDLLSSGAQTAVVDVNKDASANILMFPTKSKSTASATCYYTVTIKTSCSSPKYTRDAISLSFGDNYGNQVYAARLDDPSTGTFEQCSTDTFRIQGPCGYKTCYLYLRRSGYDGWAPDWVKIEPSSSGSQAVTFYYNAAPLPADVWYGFNLCPGDSGGGSGAGKGVLGAAGLASGLVMAFLL